MTSSPEHRKIQQRIGITMLIAGVAISALNLIRAISKGQPYFEPGGSSLLNAIWIGVAAVIAFVISRIDRVAMRLLQVLVFTLIGFYLVWKEGPYHMVGMAFVVYAIFLAIQYSFFERRLMAKTAAVVVISLGVNVGSTFAEGDIDIIAAFAGLAFVAFYLLLFWIASHEQIVQYMARNRELELERRKESVFVKFGKNVAGLVHNLRNMLTILYGLNDLMKHRCDSDDVKALIDRQRAAFDRMAGTINRTLAVVKAKQETETKPVDINELASGVAELFLTDLSFSREVKLDLQLSSSKLMVRAQPLELCEVLENLIKNSWEATTARDAETKNTIEIRTFEAPAIGFSVKDNGPGVPGLSQCSNDSCRRHFRVGQTVKEQGTGLGVPFVLEAARANDWDISIVSDPQVGTSTTVLLDGPRHESTHSTEAKKNRELQKHARQ